MWLAHDATVNAEAASITVGGRGFQFISQFFWDGHFSGTVVKILLGGKSKCNLCGRYEYTYTLSEIQGPYTLQVVSELEDKTDDRKS